MTLKNLSKNTAVYTVGNIALRASAFLLLPLYSHSLTKSDFGILQTLLFTIQIMITLVDVGVRTSIVRFLHETEKEKSLDKLLGSAFLINLFSGLILITLSTTIFLPVFGYFIPKKNINELILLTSVSAVIQTFALNIMTYYRAKNLGLHFMGFSITAAILLIISTYVFVVLNKMGIEGALFSLIFSYGILWLLISFIVYSKNGISISPSLTKKLLIFGAPLILAMVGDLLLNTVGSFFLGKFDSYEEVATYTMAFKIAQISLIVLIIPFQLAYEPYVYSNIDNPELKIKISKITTYLMLAFLLLSLVIVYIFRDLLTLILGKHFSDSYKLIYFILPGFAFMGLQYIGQSLLHIKNKTNITGITVIVYTFIGIALNYFTIKNFGIYGIILTFNLVMFLTAVTLILLGQKHYKVNFEAGRLTAILFSYILLLGLSYYLSCFSALFYYLTFGIIIIGFIITIYYSGFFTKDEKALMQSFEISKIFSKG